ncbi:SulP family inorganic anion transporter [Desulfobulbus sp.]|uniref:SulP family inorganic anion transporter n=1 Tax=Desulfobulbus sp. TaxID=895 RepID=UPI00286EC743|nr:SulP family inorganic anion transporter [Desulfobulbus sp.]
MSQSIHLSRTHALTRLLKRFVPGLLPLVRYQRSDLRHDCIAGCSVAAVALPVGIAYAAVAGVPPVYGIYASLLPLFAYALFGSSRQLITGPDAATCLMAASAIGPLAGGDPQRYMELMISLTLITGLFNIGFGLCRFGFMANFLSHPILIGYLNGVALIVLAGQLPALFGYQGGGGHFGDKLLDFIDKVPATHVPTLLLGIVAIGILLGFKRWAPRLPAPLIVAVLGIAAVYLLQLSPKGVAVLGAVPTGFPSLHLPGFDPARFETLIRHAAGIALISFVSGIMTAKSFARRNHYPIDANQELIAFGVCNIITGLAQGFPVTGADSRTAVNSAMGGRTQLVGIVAGGVILLFLLFFTAPLSLLPTAVLAAIIAVSCLGLFDFASLRELYAASRRELAFSLVTTASVLYFDVLPAVSFAVMFTFLWLLLAASHPRDAVLGQVPGKSTFHSIADYPNAITVPGLLIYRFEGNVVFFNSDYFKERLMCRITAAKTPVKWVVVDASPISMIDITALHNLIDLTEELKERGIQFKFARVRRSLRSFFDIHWLKSNPLINDAPRYDSLDAATEAFVRWEQGTSDTAKAGP